jgi:hypothetical protein
MDSVCFHILRLSVAILCNWKQEEGEGVNTDEHLYNAQGNLREWITREDVRRFIAKRFRHFLNTHPSKEGDKPYYVRMVEQITAGILSPN